MAPKPFFIDSGGFYALISPGCAAHATAAAFLETAKLTRRPAVTSDYVIDETATLLRARGLTKLLAEFFKMTQESEALTWEWITPQRFQSASKFMLKHLDQDFSFTDCASFLLMKELGLQDALATDTHFRIAGFNPLLAKD